MGMVEAVAEVGSTSDTLKVPRLWNVLLCHVNL